MDKCPTCGADTRPGDSSCLNCGNRLDLLIPPQQRDVHAMGTISDRTNAPLPAEDWSPEPFTPAAIPPDRWNDSDLLTVDSILEVADLLGADDPLLATRAVINKIDKYFDKRLLQDRYQILEVIGQGGMGTIYKAEDTKLGNRPVAVKELKMPRLQSLKEREEALLRFEHEALLLARLNHPSLPNIYDHFSQNDNWYFVMEYIPGQTLAQYLRDIPTKRLNSDEVLVLANKLCSILGYLHSQTPPIIHGDLKPENIILTPDGNLYLIDFGIARLFDESISYEKTFVSPGYSAPEQYKHALISPRADIYSLGSILFRLLLGRFPLTSGVSSNTLQLGYQLWVTDLELLIMRMVEKDERKRPQGINTVKQELQRIATQRVQELNSLRDTPQLIEAALTGEKPNNLQTPHLIEAPDLVTSLVTMTIRLSLDRIDALKWSPNGTHLIVANDKGEVHFYKWPPEEKLYNSHDEALLPLRTWLLIEEDMKVRNESLEWSPDSKQVAISTGNRVLILDVSSENSPSTYIKHRREVEIIRWSPDGNYIALADYLRGDNYVQIWSVNTKNKLYEYRTSGLSTISWSPDSKYIAFALTTITLPVDSFDAASEEEVNYINMPGLGIQIFKVTEASKVSEYNGQEGLYTIREVVWSSDGTYLASCADDGTIHIWEAKTGQKLRSLEGHTDPVMRIAFLDHGRLLASLSRRGDARIWRTDIWLPVESLQIDYASRYNAGTGVFHPSAALIAAFNYTSIVRLYEIDTTQFYTGSSKIAGVQYTNAKVVLLGDSGVGKSGLGLVLSRQTFEPTESTHGRLVWLFSRRENKLSNEHREIRETLLWDLAGQPGYRLIHQLHLSEVAVALVVFDAHSETDPLAGISHWVRALRTAQRVRGNKWTLKMLLVLARIDRGGKRVSQGRIDEIVQSLGFDAYFETSAKEGTNIAALANTIEDSIDWEQLPKVTSTEMFHRIRMFLITEKQTGLLLPTADDLYKAFLRTWGPWGVEKDLSAEFATGIRLLESTGLIRQLSFGNLVLLQPELLDTYASALVNAVRDEPDGLGSILEEVVHAGKFTIPKDERIADREQERLLLIAMVEDLLSYEIALREQGEDGPYLVFPSESTRENPALPNPENASIVFEFEGPVLNIYATLAVRLSHSNFFVRKDLWKDAIIYEARVGGTCGIWLKLIEDGKGELTLFFDEHASQETRFHFEEYIRVHLQRKALPESIVSRRIHRCECGFVATDQLVRMRKERNFDWFKCPICDTRVDLRDPVERLREAASSRISEMDRAADIRRAREAAHSTVQGKQETKDFDVFLCYHPADRSTVIEIGERLKERGILPWLDEWELRPGLPWQRLLGQQIEQIKSAAVFVGKDGVGPWQEQELEAFLRQFVRRGCPVIPVILNEAPGEPALPLFLEGMRWVDFHPQATVQDIGPIEQLIWGITGKRLAMR